MPPIVQFIEVTKRYGPVVANDDVTLNIEKGEIHGILGENGAGKSTLVRILYGVERPDSGTILLRGEKVDIPNSATAIDYGIGLVHQDFMLINDYNIPENFSLGAETTRAGILVNFSDAEARAREVLELLGIDLPLDVPVGNFSVEERQIIEIGKALYRGAEILILDEPTSVLSPQKIETLFRILEKLRDEGKTIVLITHKLAEVFRIVDRLSVLRRGRHISTLSRTETTPEEVIRMMVGEGTVLDIARPSSRLGEACLSVKDVSLINKGQTLLENVSFDVHEGEIFALTGVGGNGQAELVDIIMGLAPFYAGEIRMAGNQLNGRDVQQRRATGMAYVPEDRVRRGSAGSLSVLDNLIMGHHRHAPIRSRAGIRDKEATRFSEALVKKYGIVIGSLQDPAGTLSGGNLQKLIVARELTFNAHFLLIAYPSQGIDLRTTSFIYNELLARRNAGCAILLVSGDLDEVMALSDRIGVMYRGKLVTVTTPAETTHFQLGQWMTGAGSMN